jgi:hypothetical protein
VAHRGASSGVAAGRRGGAVVVGELSGEGAPARETRREELGEVLRGFSGTFIGAGGGPRGGQSNGGGEWRLRPLRRV